MALSGGIRGPLTPFIESTKSPKGVSGPPAKPDGVLVLDFANRPARGAGRRLREVEATDELKQVLATRCPFCGNDPSLCSGCRR